jgi:hypothetical protein
MPRPETDNEGTLDFAVGETPCGRLSNHTSVLENRVAETWPNWALGGVADLEDAENLDTR